MNIDRSFDKSCCGHNSPSGFRIICVDPCVLDNVAYVLLGPNLDGDLALPSGRNGRVEDGRRAGSIRAHPFDPERFVSLIGDKEGMVQEIPLLDFPKVDLGFFNQHPGAVAGQSKGGENPCQRKTETKK